MSDLIEVFLRQDIKTLGNRGEVVKVKKGYARNYLFPQRLAVLYNKKNVLEFEQEKKRLAHAGTKLISNFKELVGQIETASCTIEVKANDEGILFGSVSPQMVIDSLAKENITGIKEEMIILETPIKELGVYRIKINLYPEISATCRLWVVEESDSQGKTLSTHQSDHSDS